MERERETERRKKERSCSGFNEVRMNGERKKKKGKKKIQQWDGWRKRGKKKEDKKENHQ